MRVAVDANALDRKTEARSRLVDRFEALAASGALTLHIGEGVGTELAHPATPEAARPLPSSPAEPPRRRPLTAAEHIARMRVRAIVQGRAKPGKHERDAAHLSEAAEAGCRFFLTYDGRLLARRSDLERFALPPTLKIVTIEEFLERTGNQASEAEPE